MAGSRKFIVGAGTLVVVAAAAWFGGNYYVKTQVEDKVRSYLVENNMQDNVSWASLDATILGNAAMHDVKVIRKDDPAKYFTIKEVKVHDLNTDTEDKKVDFSFSGLADETGNSPFLAVLKEHGDELGYEKLPLVDGRVRASLDEKQDALDYDATLQQPELGNFHLDLKADKVVDLINTIRTQEKELSTNPLLLLDKLSPVTFREMNVRFEDAGLMPRVVKVQQGVAAVDGKPTAEQVEAFEARLEKSEADCRQQAPALGVADADSVCNSISKFMKNESKTLSISSTPTPPLQLMSFVMQTQLGGSTAIAKAVKQLNLKITN